MLQQGELGVVRCEKEGTSGVHLDSEVGRVKRMHLCIEGSIEISDREIEMFLFFCCERLSASMARSLHLSFICIPQSTRALDQGGVEPRQAVSPKALRPWTIPLRYSVGYREIEMFHLPSHSIALITKLNVSKVANGTTTGSKQINVLGFAVEVVDKQGDDSPFLVIESKKGVDTGSYPC